MFLIIATWFIDIPKAFTIIMKRNGDRGSPCCNPLKTPKKPLGDALIKTENLILSMQLKIQSIEVSSKLKSFNTLSKNLQSTLSHAFFMSNFTRMLFLKFFCIKLIASFTKTTPSKIDLFDTNLVFSSEIMYSSICMALLMFIKLGDIHTIQRWYLIEQSTKPL